MIIRDQLEVLDRKHQLYAAYVAALKTMLKPLRAEEAYHLQAFEDAESTMKEVNDLVILERTSLESCLMQSSGILKYTTV
jgi:hypothetical protein